MASVVRLATLRFCGRFLDRRIDPCGRQYDQMTQAARSGKARLKAQGERFAQTGGFREQLTAATRAAQENAPECPDCGKSMHKRRAKAGPTPGREFWGCTGYPECRGIREIHPPT